MDTSSFKWMLKGIPESLRIPGTLGKFRDASLLIANFKIILQKIIPVKSYQCMMFNWI